MAPAMIPSPEVQAKAKALVELRNQWVTVRDARHGWRRIVMPSLSTEGHVYYVHPRGDACSCEAGRRGLLCCHRLAARTVANRDAIQAWVDDQDAGVADLAFAEVGTRLRGDRAGAPLLKRYEDIWPAGED